MFESSIDRLGVHCKRHGPGRLPGADRRVLGAGYAFASTALLTTGVFFLGSTFLLLLGNGLGIGLFRNFGEFGFTFGAGAVPIVTLSAFAGGVLTWRFLPNGTPAFGIVGGLLATLVTYVVSTGVLLVVIVVASYGEYYYTDAGAIGTTLIIVVVAALLTAWFALPIGAAGGYIYERVRTGTD